MSFFDRWFRPSKAKEAIERSTRAATVASKYAKRHPGSFSTGERSELAEALAVFEGASDFRSALSVARLLGDSDSEARMLQELGEIEALEALLATTAAVERAHLAKLSATKDAATLLEMGHYGEARAVLERAIALMPNEEEFVRIHAELLSRWLHDRRCTFVADSQSWRFISASEATLGREGDILVRGPSVSRVHARVILEGADWFVEDAGSRHGTFVGGFSLGSRCRVGVGGIEVSFGPDASLRLDASDSGILLIEATNGQNRGARASVGTQTFGFRGVAQLDFDSGLPRVRSVRESPWGLLNGRSSQDAWLLRGDAVVIDGVSYRVEP